MSKIIQKQYFRRDVAGYVSPYADPFQYKTMTELGRLAFVDAFIEVNRGSLGRDLESHMQMPELAFNGMIEFAASAFLPEQWKLAYLHGALVGMVLPTRYFDTPEEGSLFHFGLVSGMRGKGLAPILHAKGLQDLSEMGILRYVGSTDVQNASMIQVFLKNGCKPTSIRDQEILEPVIVKF